MATATPVLAPDVSWQRVIEEVVRAHERRSEGSQYAAGLRSILGLFLRAFPDPLAATALEIEQWAYARGPGQPGRPAKEPRARTVANRLAGVAHLFRHLRRAGLTDANPTADIPRPRCEPLIPRGLTSDQVDRLFAGLVDGRHRGIGPYAGTCTGERQRAAFLFVLSTGLRLSEAGGLRVRDLDKSRDGKSIYMRIRRKRGKWEHKQIPPTAVAELEAAYGRRLLDLPPDAHVISMGAAGLYKAVVRAARRAGLHVTPHMLRHSNAQIREDLGEDVRSIADQLGHDSPAYTGRYLKRLRGVDDPGGERVAQHLRALGGRPGVRTG